MAVDIGGPVAEGNSPMPKADIPLAPAAPANPQISDMMKFMQDCMEQQSKRLGMQLEPLIRRIERLEAPKPDYDNMVPDYTADEYNTWTNPHDDLEYQSAEPTDLNPPPRIDDDAFMADYAEHEKQLNAEFDARTAEEEENHILYKMGLGPTDEDIRNAGGDDAMVKANELARITRRAEYLRSTQSIEPPP